MSNKVTTDTIPCISTAHMPHTNALKRVRERGAAIVAEYEQGGYVYTVHAALTQPGFDWLVTIADWARTKGFAWVRFDSDGDVVDGLPAYDWEQS